MLTTTTPITQIREHYRADTRDLLRILLNTTSATEANIALDVLRDSLPERALVAACNLREVIGALPRAPFPMRVDEEVLARVAGLTRHVAALERVLDDGSVLTVTTAGNLALDIIVSRDGAREYLTCLNRDCDRITPAVVDLLVESPCLLDALIELVTNMGLVFNPKFYLSLEDWGLEYAADVFEGLTEIF